VWAQSVVRLTDTCQLSYLDEKIDNTDALIDETVYDLYGLTDEEAEMVEEAVE
jgi:hypothetical protein